jgi:nitrogen fixation protein FixH
MLAFFGTVIGVNVGMAVLASRTWTGLIVPNTYIASQEYQEKLDALHAQQSLGWVAELSYSSGVVRLTCRDSDDQPVDLGEVTAQISRPIGTVGERTLVLIPATAGVFEAAVDLSSGAWDFVVTSEATAAGPFELHQRVVVGSGQ